MPDPLKAAYDLLKRRISKTQLIALLVSSPQQFEVFSDLEAWERSPFLYPAQIAALVKFACLYAGRKRRVRKLDYRRYDMAKLANPYKDLWQLAESVSPYSDDPELLGAFLLRFVYQQLPFIYNLDWSEQLVKQTRRLYCDQQDGGSSLEPHRGLPGISISDFIDIGLQTYEIAKTTPALKTSDFFGRLAQFPRTRLENFLQIISANPVKFSKYYQENKARKLFEIPYELNPILKYPLIQHRGVIFFPIPFLILYAITKGIFFYLLDLHKGKFATDFGYLFERYVKTLVSRYIDGIATVLDESQEKAIGWSKKVNDITILGGPRRSLALLLECKTSLLYLEAKQTAALPALEDSVGKNLKRAYEQLASKWSSLASTVSVPPSLQTFYQNVKHDLVFPIVLTYDPLMWANAPEVLGNILRRSVKGKLLFQPQLWNVDELERLMQIIPPDKFFSTVASKCSTANVAKDLDLFLQEIDGKGVYRNWLRLIFIPPGETRALQMLKMLRDHELQGS